MALWPGLLLISLFFSFIYIQKFRFCFFLGWVLGFGSFIVFTTTDWLQ